MDRAAVRAEFDNQMRRNPAAERGALVEREPRVTRIISGGDGWSGVLWSDLTEADADAVIGTQVSRFAELGRPWEWKYYSYDQPAGLPGRLEAAGFAPGPAETLLVAQIADLDADVSAPPGVELVPVTDASGVAAVVGVHDEVFGGEHAAIGSAIMAALASRPRPVEAVAAVAEGRAVSAGRVEFPAGSDFASLWGGGTLPGWRGRGVFRSLVAYRARLARDRGFRYLQVDASADSSPILQRLGFAELARTTPFVYPGYQGDVVPVRHVHGLAVSAADTLNQVFPLASLRQADRPADADHPFGHGQERYFWPLLAALGIFIAGAGEAWSCR